MKFTVRVVPNARKVSVVMDGSRGLVVHVDAPAREGKANERLVEILAGHFGVAKSLVRVRSGLSGRHKVVEIASGSRSS